MNRLQRLSQAAGGKRCWQVRVGPGYSGVLLSPLGVPRGRGAVGTSQTEGGRLIGHQLKILTWSQGGL